MTKTLLNNRYQVIQVVSAGGFGETFLAEDTHMPSRRRCVIKQLKPVTNDPKTYQIIQQRFEREAATLEFLGEGSEQIPKLYAYFCEQGQFYLVQEWIQGQTLRDIVQAKRPLDETVVREILLSLLPVLDYVHSKGIIHRDIKPDNIILRSANSKPVLIDFGAVKETIRSADNIPTYLTQSLVIGTPGYMPSEQAVGRPVYATDIYSLGLTAIYLLTGKHPHELETNLQTGEILWREHAQFVSSHLAMVLHQAIQPQVSDRYTTASKMLYALQSATASHPPTVATTPTVALSPVIGASNQQKAPTPAINQSSAPSDWQKPALIVGSLVVGCLIGAVAIASISRAPKPEATIATSPTPTDLAESQPINPVPAPTPVVTAKPTEPPVVLQPPPTFTAPTYSPPEPQETPAPDPPSVTFTPQPEVDAPVVLDTPKTSPTASILNPEQKQTLVIPTPELTPTPHKNNPPGNISVGTGKQNVPAFPIGTPRSSVETVLGTAKDLKGVWGNTRAVTYQLVPNQIDLGYLFDRDSGELRQTEAAFVQSVDLQVMQKTLDGMLSNQATEDIKQGLQQVQQRQLDNYQFSQGSFKGQIVRQDCDMIYISIWDAQLHDFVRPSIQKKC